MIYAPIVIPTLCRYEHFVRCIESLKKNIWAEHTDVYIALDFPKKESHWDGYRKIKEYLQGDFSEFHSFTVFERKKNYGTSKNSTQLTKECLKHHDRYIYSDDDIEFSPNFIQYMDICLERYEKDDSVVAVTGYSYPVDWEVAEGCTVVKQNFICSSWGRGFWRNKRKRIRRYLKHFGLSRDFSRAFKSNHFSLMLDPAVIEYSSVVTDGQASHKSLLNCTSDVAMRIYLAVKGKYVIMPTVTKARNHGFDGSGEYCQGVNFCETEKYSANNYPFNLQPMDSALVFECIEDSSFDISANRKLLNDFENADPRVLESALATAAEFSAKPKWYSMFLVGTRMVLRLWDRIKRLLHIG